MTDKLNIAKLGREITLSLPVTELRFLHSALPLTALNQCIKFHFIPSNNFRNMLLTRSLLQKLKREVTVNTADRVSVLAICNSPLYQCIKHTCQVLGKSKSEIARAPLIFAYNLVIKCAEKSGAQV